MITSGSPFAGDDLFDRLARTDGYHDATWLNYNEKGITALNHVSPGLQEFLNGINKLLTLLQALPNALESFGLTGSELSSYTTGTAYYRTMPSMVTESGRFHYDTGHHLPTQYLNAGAVVLRFVAGSSTDGWPVTTVFSNDPHHHNLLVHEVDNKESLVQPPNNHVVMFSEGGDLHGRASAPERPHARTAFFSAALYKSSQEPDLSSCSALAPLRCK